MSERIDILATCNTAFHPGLAALLNSLVQAGYRGTVWIAKSGPIPTWARIDEKRGDLAICTTQPGLTLKFFDSDLGFFSTGKPQTILDLWDRDDGAAERVFYFDCDIVVTFPWRYFADWHRKGVALCCDPSETTMPPTHPRRGAWEEALEGIGRRVRWRPDFYVNSGFVGLCREDRELVELWCELSAYVESQRPGPMVPHSDRSDPFCYPDQDTLNAALMAFERPLSVMGPEGMGFGNLAAAAMFHALSTPKPWQRSLLRAAFKGAPPTPVDHIFWRFAEGPFPALPPAEQRRRRRALRWATRISSVYRSPITDNR